MNQDEQVRENFIRSLSELISIAVASNHWAASAVLSSLKGAMLQNNEIVLGYLCAGFSEQQLNKSKLMEIGDTLISTCLLCGGSRVIAYVCTFSDQLYYIALCSACHRASEGVMKCPATG